MKTISKIQLFSLALITLMVMGLSACESDGNLDQKPAAVDDMTAARDILKGDIVLSTKATMNGIDKTRLPQGCPARFNFEWMSDNIMRLKLDAFSVGNMPLTVWFQCQCKFMQLNSWEKDEYKGEGWLKFKGENGVVTYSEKDDGSQRYGSGAGVQGYLNVKTKEVIFNIEFNVMNVRSETFLQTIDYTRINRFAEEFAQYERDLKKYKEEHPGA